MGPPMKTPVLERVRKLLALAESANEHEAANAAAAAQRLITAERLELADLEYESEAPPRLERQELDAPEGRCRVWRELLAGAVAESNGCFSYVRHKRVGIPSVQRSQRMLLGSAGNVESAHYLYTYFCGEVERLAKQAVMRRFPGGLATRASGKTHGPRAWAESFRLGAASACAERVRAAHLASLAFASTSALAVIDREAIALLAEIEAMNPEAAPRIETHSEAFGQGKEAGEAIDLALDAPQLEAGKGELPEG
jgi:Protein of unknown function (DUF2786)